MAQLLFPRDLRSPSAPLSGAAAKRSPTVDPEARGLAAGESAPPQQDAAPPASADHGSTAPSPKRDRPLVLVVDDEEMILTVASQILSRRGLEVVVARDGSEGLQIFAERRHEIDLVLLDLNMPGRGGYATLREIRKIKVNTPVILTSGFGQQESSALHDGNESIEFLQKPYRAQALVAKVLHVLGTAAP